MTIAAFDPGCLGNYRKRKYLLHIQWNDGTGQICRYALVETMSENDIEHKTKKKYKDETELSQLEIWEKKYKTDKYKIGPVSKEQEGFDKMVKEANSKEKIHLESSRRKANKTR